MRRGLSLWLAGLCLTAAGCLDPDTCRRYGDGGNVAVTVRNAGPSGVANGFLSEPGGALVRSFSTDDNGAATVNVPAGGAITMATGEGTAMTVYDLRAGDEVRFGEDEWLRPLATLRFAFTDPDWASRYEWLTPCGAQRANDGDSVVLPEDCLFPPGELSVLLVALDDGGSARGYARIDVPVAFEDVTVNVQVPRFNAPRAAVTVTLDELPAGYGALAPRLALVDDGARFELPQNADGSFSLPEGDEELVAWAAASYAPDTGDAAEGPSDVIEVHRYLSEPAVEIGLDMSGAAFGRPPAGRAEGGVWRTSFAPDRLAVPDAVVARTERGGVEWTALMSACAPDDGIVVPELPPDFAAGSVDVPDADNHWDLTWIDVDDAQGYEAYVSSVSATDPERHAPIGKTTVRMQSTL